MYKLILLFSILFLTGCSNQTEPVLGGDTCANGCMELLVKTSDSSPSNLPKEQRGAKILAEEKKASAKQGYIIDARPAGYEWGKEERNPQKFIIVKIPAADYNEEWLKPEIDENKNVASFRAYRLPLEEVLTAQEIDGLATAKSVVKTLTDTTKIVPSTFESLPAELSFNNKPETVFSYLKKYLFGTPAYAITTKTICSSGCDYTSIANWQTGQAGDLTGTGPSVANITGAYHDTSSNFQLFGWTTTASDYIQIYTTGTARHEGKWDTAKFYWSSTDTIGLFILENYVRADGLQIETLSPTSNYMNPIAWVDGFVDASNEIRISNNILKGHNDATYLQAGIGGDDADAIVYVWNNVIYNLNTGSARYGISNAGGTIYAYNNTIDGGQIALYRSGTNAITAVNNIMLNQSFAPAFGTFAAGTDYNAADASSIGYTVTGGGNTHDRTSQTFSFTDSANGDYHLTSSDTGALDFGVSDPGSGLFSDDIDSETRSGSWDIGADEYVAAVSASPDYQEEVIFFD